MDEKTKNLNPKFQSKEISDDDYLIRQVSVSLLDENNFPKEACFMLNVQIKECELSFNLKSLIDAEANYKLIGIQQNKKQNWKNPEMFSLFEFPVEFLKTLINYEKIKHTPSYKGAPAPVGKPNNIAHSSLFCGEFTDRTRSQMRGYCEVSNNKLKADMVAVMKEVNELRARGNNTPFHYYWDF
jgi:hypothetical protein